MPDPLTPERLAELAELEMAATPGPWKPGETSWRKRSNGDWRTPLNGPKGTIASFMTTPQYEKVMTSGELNGADLNDDARFVASLRNAAPALLAVAEENARLRARVAELERERDILVAWEAAELSEGQASRLLGVDRVTARGMKLDTIARAGRWRE